jgi:hypothetical protein
MKYVGISFTFLCNSVLKIFRQDVYPHIAMLPKYGFGSAADFVSDIVGEPAPEELLPLWQSDAYYKSSLKRKFHKTPPTTLNSLNKSTSTAFSDAATLNADLEKGAHDEPELLPACEIYFTQSGTKAGSK